MTSPIPPRRNTPSPYGWEQWQHDLLPSTKRAAALAALTTVVVACGMAGFALTTGHLPNSNPITATIFHLDPTVFEVILLTTVTALLSAVGAAWLVWTREARQETFSPFKRRGLLNTVASAASAVGVYCLANMAWSDHTSLMVGLIAWVLSYYMSATWIIDRRWRAEMRQRAQ